MLFEVFAHVFSTNLCPAVQWIYVVSTLQLCHYWFARTTYYLRLIWTNSHTQKGTLIWTELIVIWVHVSGVWEGLQAAICWLEWVEMGSNVLELV